MKTHTSKSGHTIAYRRQKGEGEVGVIFLAGFRSDMASTKAEYLSEWCAEQKVTFTSFDYFGHGKSGGEFIDYTIGKGVEDVLEILDHIATGPQILVGSSMGGWIGLHAARERKGQVRGLVGVAAAPDFTDRMRPQMNAEQQKALADDGVVWAHSEYYGNDYPITQKLIDNGRELCLLDDVIGLEIPIHLLQGQLDDSVPWDTALKISERVMSDEVTITLVKDGDHRLNRPQDLALLGEAVGRMLCT
jgi:pimeloyl-ACP methyl ester carboxylesterase